MHLYTLANDTLTEKDTKSHGGAVMDIKYSPDGSYMAACDSYRKVILYQLPDYQVSALIFVWFILLKALLKLFLFK